MGKMGIHLKKGEQGKAEVVNVHNGYSCFG